MREVALALLLALAGGAGAPQSRPPLQPGCGEIRDVIEAAPPASRILLPAQRCAVEHIIRVPSEVEIAGRPGSRLEVEIGDRSSRPAFDLSGSEGVVLRDFDLVLGPRAKGVRAVDARRIELRDLHILGNLRRVMPDDPAQDPGDSSLAVEIASSSDVVIEGLQIRDSFGGVYVREVAGAAIRNNRLTGVNFGNIVVSGTDILIEGNELFDPGLPSANHHASGDGVTIGPDTRGIVIRDNVFEDGNCYFVHAPRGRLWDITVENNAFRRGTTTAVYLRDATGVRIVGNEFTANEAHGVALFGPADATVTDNLFDDDSVYLSDSADTWLQGNVFRQGEVTALDQEGWMVQGAATVSARRTTRVATRPPSWLGFGSVLLASLVTWGLLARAGRVRTDDNEES